MTASFDRMDAHGQPADGSAVAVVRPWPEGYEPRTLGERRLWEAFGRLLADPLGPLTLRLVAETAISPSGRVGMSRTVISYPDCAHKELRSAVLKEIKRREEGRQASEDAMVATVEPRPGPGVRHWQAVAQRADGLLAEYEARAVRAEGKSRRARELLSRVLDDIRAGRWTRVDEDAVAMADLAAELGAPAKALSQVENLRVE